MDLGKSLSEIHVKDLMTKQLISADPSTTLFQISKMMEQGVGAILVKKDSVPAGIITDRDFAIKIAANKVPLETTVDKVASYPLKTIPADQPVLKAAEMMSSLKIRKLAVSENEKIVGIITSTDIVNLISASKI
ncbi:MAG: CBS domain-containing protein [Nitrosarchaeum sp.]|nr:CBS domain-containing protein [Nitrosarchaeum sp.]